MAGLYMCWSCAVAAVLMQAALCGPAAAGDRPYLATNSAAAEEDDDAVWSVESWLQRVGSVRAISIAPEYAFDPTTSVQFEFTRARERSAGATDQQVEVELKHLLNHIARDGYGWGIVASIQCDKAQGSGWRGGSVAIKLPFTLALWDGAGALHFNAGVAKPRDARRELTWSAAIERQVIKRTTLFAEVARDGDATLLHAGVRWWLKKEKLAVDLAAQRIRAPASRDSGWVMGLGWYDQ